MQTQATKRIRTAEQERILEAAVRHLESVHRVVLQKRRSCKIISFPLERSGLYR